MPGWRLTSARSSEATRTSHGLARSAGSSITRPYVASIDSAATSVITISVSAPVVSAARGAGS